MAETIDEGPAGPFADGTARARDEQTFAIIGAAMEVHGLLGSGLPETAYHGALVIEFGLRHIPFFTEVPCPVAYKGRKLPGHYRADFVCFDRVVVEVKARSTMGPADYAQVLNYLRASGRRVGLLFNFGAPKLDYRRFVEGSAGRRRSGQREARAPPDARGASPRAGSEAIQADDQ
jgi:GxxExxY protein